MSSFFADGILHITDFEGYDHMLFLLALCAPFTYREWKQVIWLATAFTVGHSISLALAATDAVHFSSSLIEFCIPITILLTAGYHFIDKQSGTFVRPISYVITCLFGIIHGLGFSGYFRMISTEGESFISQLFMFNLGVEVGQLVIIAAILSVVAILHTLIPAVSTHLKKIIALPTIALAIWLAIEKWPF
ncbi:MAG: HupE/UreJ family protein [Flavobacteriales bacterium]